MNTPKSLLTGFQACALCHANERITMVVERNQMSAPLAALKKRMEEEDKAWAQHRRTKPD